jgi:hypothetical protein
MQKLCLHSAAALISLLADIIGSYHYLLSNPGLQGTVAQCKRQESPSTAEIFGNALKNSSLWYGLPAQFFSL